MGRGYRGEGAGEGARAPSRGPASLSGEGDGPGRQSGGASVVTINSAGTDPSSGAAIKPPSHSPLHIRPASTDRSYSHGEQQVTIDDYGNGNGIRGSRGSAHERAPTMSYWQNMTDSELMQAIDAGRASDSDGDGDGDDAYRYMP